MQTNIAIDFNTISVDCGHTGEHNAVQFNIAIPNDMLCDGHSYRVAIQPEGDVDAYRSESLTPVDGFVSYALPQSLTGSKSLVLQLEEYSGDEFLRKSDVVIARLRDSVSSTTQDVDGDAGIVGEITANTEARHTHDNKSVIDKFSEVDGELKYDGSSVGGGLDVNADGGFAAGINMETGTVARATYGGAVGAGAIAETGGAVGAGARAVNGFAGGAGAIAPTLGAVQLGQGVNSTQNTLKFRTYLLLDADGKIPDDRLSAAPHTHTNKTVLDKFTEVSGELKYNGAAVGGATVQSRYYANDWSEAIIYSISGSDAAFEIVTNPIPADAIVIDVAVRYTPDSGATYTDIPINELYLHNHGSSPLVAFGDRINLMNNSTYVMNGVRTCATISAAGTGGELISYAAASMSDSIILGFTIYYI